MTALLLDTPSTLLPAMSEMRSPVKERKVVAEELARKGLLLRALMSSTSSVMLTSVPTDATESLPNSV